VRAVAATVRIPGRLELVDEDPPTYHDSAHNPSGMRALRDSLVDVSAGRPIVAIVSVLDDKDAAAMLATLLPYCAHVIYCANANPRTLPPGTLHSLGGQLRDADAPPAEIEPDPLRAMALARRRAGELDGIVLATGSVYLLADLRRGEHSGEVSAL
jgi:dihydrofolate synthase/folylpolyglutamate synthase